MRVIWIVLITAVFTRNVIAEEGFDFVVVGSSCKALVSYNVMSDESLKVVDADTPVLFCRRNSKVITCNVTHVEEHKKMEERIYKLEMDAPPILFFQAENGSETAYMNVSNNTGSYSSRIFGEKFMGQKVCSTLYFTYDQYKLLRKEN
jgi:hypothetical protein